MLLPWNIWNTHSFFEPSVSFRWSPSVGQHTTHRFIDHHNPAFMGVVWCCPYDFWGWMSTRTHKNIKNLDDHDISWTFHILSTSVSRISWGYMAIPAWKSSRYPATHDSKHRSNGMARALAKNASARAHWSSPHRGHHCSSSESQPGPGMTVT